MPKECDTKIREVKREKKKVISITQGNGREGLGKDGNWFSGINKGKKRKKYTPLER